MVTDPHRSDGSHSQRQEGLFTTEVELFSEFSEAETDPIIMTSQRARNTGSPASKRTAMIDIGLVEE
jgi:hypothetical protein